jgi:hypothetical protein
MALCRPVQDCIASRFDDATQTLHSSGSMLRLTKSAGRYDYRLKAQTRDLGSERAIGKEDHDWIHAIAVKVPEKGPQHRFRATGAQRPGNGDDDSHRSVSSTASSTAAGS